MNNLSDILCQMYPNIPHSFRGDSLDNIEWLDWPENLPKPTQADIDAFVTANITPFAYRELRRKEYPPIGDQLDAIMKGGQPLADMQAQCMAVKVKYPKPV